METGTILLIIGLALLAILVILALVVLVRTLTFSSPKKQTEPITLAEVDGRSVAEHLGQAVQLKTIANQDQSKIDPDIPEILHPRLQRELDRPDIRKSFRSFITGQRVRQGPAVLAIDTVERTDLPSEREGIYPQ